MSSDVLFYGWDKATPGREKEAGALFQEYLPYLGRLQQEGMIDSFDVVLLTLHGGDLNGFFLIKGDIEKLDELRRTEEFNTFLTRSGIVIDGGGLIPGVIGEGVTKQMARWMSLLPD
ncbi:MAG: hypothetical protein ACK2T3_08110 [Candidatus Promineifilaceae bacterium]